MNKKIFTILILPTLALVGGYLIRQALATSNSHTWTNGLVGYWSFDGQYTTSTAGTRDISNNGNWGAFNGGVKPAPGVVGQGLSFDGVDDYVNAGNGASLNITGSALTLEAWVKVNSWAGSGDYAVIAENYQASTGGYLLERDNLNNRFYAGVWTAAGWKAAAPTETLSENTWYHLVEVFNGTSVIYYVNGVSKATASFVATTIASSANSFIMGGKSTGNRFNGSIDEVRVYNRALSADEVKQHYDQTRRNLVINQPSGTPPVGWWKMDEGRGTTVRDYSSNANNGTMYWMATSTNGSWADGKIGKALSFDGTDDYVNVLYNSVFNIVGNITIEAWVYSNGCSGIGEIVRHTNQYDLSCNNNQFQFTFYNGLTWQGSTFLSLPAGSWYHIIGQRDGDTLRVFKNGAEGTPASSTGNPASDTNSLFIGTNGGTERYFNGFIDEVRIYNYARTADQIAADFRAGAYRTNVNTSVPSTWWTDGLVGYWNFDGQNTTSTNGTRDTSGQNSWGAFSGGVKPTAGVVGQALSFDGVNDYVNVGNPASLRFGAPITIEAWIKPNDLNDRCIAYHLQTAWTNGWQFILGSGGTYGTVGVSYGDGGNAYDAVTANFSSSPIGQWTHVVAVIGLTQKGMFINGVGSMVASDGMAISSTNLYIGAAGGGWYFFNGLIDEVRIYNRALTADEVMTHYQQTRRNLGI